MLNVNCAAPAKRGAQFGAIGPIGFEAEPDHSVVVGYMKCQNQ